MLTRTIALLLILTLTLQGEDSQAVTVPPVSGPSLFEFSGRSDQREQYGFDTPEAFDAPEGVGYFQYRALSDDLDPEPRVGVYDVLVEEFQLSFAGDQLSLFNVPAVATVKDDFGCDCFFVDMLISGQIAGQSFDRLFVNIQNEFGPEAFTMFSDDSLPLDGLNVPHDSWTTLMLHEGSELTIFDIRADTIALSRVPEPSSLCLVAFLLAADGMRRTPVRS